MSGLRLHFYTTREDLEPAIRGIEAAASLRYALTGLHTSRVFPEYASALEIPSLGRATGDSAVTCEAYLVVAKQEKISIREICQNSGGTRYAVDQFVNPRSIIFQSGGVRNGGVIIHGRVATTAQSEEAKEIFSVFRKWLKKSFEKHRAFYVGPTAMRLKEEGARLTMAVQSPKEYDLA
jgi:hypothetical protein